MKKSQQVIPFINRNHKRKIKADARLDKDLIVKLDTIFKNSKSMEFKWGVTKILENKLGP